MTDTLADLYARIPRIECRGLCADSCGPIVVSTLEADTAAARGVTLPTHADALRQLARAKLGQPVAMCPALGAFHQCTIYPDRPMICRLWGVVETMPCTHGCRPDRYLTDEEGQALYEATLRIGGRPS